MTPARRGSRVTGLDITPALLEHAHENADIVEVDDIEWREGDATDLPFPAEAFDVTLSCVGHMFAVPPEAAAAELLCVSSPGGRIGFTSWTSERVVPAMAAVLQTYLPPDSDAPEPPYLWSDRPPSGHGLATTFPTGVSKPGRSSNAPFPRRTSGKEHGPSRASSSLRWRMSTPRTGGLVGPI